MSRQEQMIAQLSSVSLIAHDLHLYLDTHPENVQAKLDHKKASEEYQKLKVQYENEYGPLLNYGHQSLGTTDSWIQGPWPWQNK